MGGKKGGGARTPYEAPNTLSSAQRLRIVDAICEGVVDGFAHGNEHPLKSVYFNDTPVQNADGSYNFKGVTALFQAGTPDQSYIPGFEGTERTVSVSAAVKKNTPVVRAVTDAAISRLRVTVGVERNVQVLDNGDSVPAHTHLRIELLNDSGVKAMRMVSFTEKGSGAFYHDEVFDSLPAVPFNIRVTRITADSQTDRVTNGTFFASFVAASDAKLCYPNTALAALLIDSEQFGNQVPRRNYLLRGMQVQVPANYDPETRTYDGMWDGSFKSAWTNNPAWVFYDLLTSPRYSTLARRLHAADIDKWSLYQAARYCDEMVADGFGGQEPRFVCNAYITDQRQAGELLEDLASVFAGLAVWNGNQVSVVLDQAADPVAAYGNHNVENGLFTYNSAALKAIHTAVHVRYADKHDAYRSKTEYVAADAETIRRYGLNIKSVTAFGCDSRGQAVRFGQWILQTGLRQQDAVTFTVGREGLKHLPYDIIQVADNDYAGVVLSGRALAVSGSLVTLDREAPADVAGGHLKYTVFVQRDGQTVPEIRSLQVASRPVPNQLQLAAPAEGLAEMDGWVLAGKVKPRLYRAIGIKENGDEGTYTITALRHDPAKYAAVDGSARFAETTTLHAEPKLLNSNVQTDGGDWVLTWDNLAADGAVLSYDIKVYRNGRLYRHIPDAETAEVRLQNLPDGNYRAEIRGRNARGKLSAPLVQSWQISYTVSNVRTTPKLFAVGLNWHLPPLPATVHTEIWYAATNDRNQAAKLAALPYPQSEYTLNGVKLNDRYWFWLRVVDDKGRSGEWSAAVQGVCDTDPSPIVGLIQGQITESAFSQQLKDSLDQRFASIDLPDVSNLLHTAQELGNRVQTLENIDATRALQINTVTAAQQQAAAALQAEKQARIAGDQAEAAARQVLAAQHGQISATVAELQQTVADTGGKVQSIYGLKVEAVGNRKAVAGLTLGADGQTGESQFLLAANKVAFIDPQSQQVVPAVVTTIQDGQAKMGINGDLLVDGMILGRHIKAHETLTAPNILGGNLNIGNGRFVVNQQGQVSISAEDGNIGLKISTDRIEVYDETGSLRVRLGKLI